MPNKFIKKSEKSGKVTKIFQEYDGAVNVLVWPLWPAIVHWKEKNIVTMPKLIWADCAMYTRALQWFDSTIISQIWVIYTWAVGILVYSPLSKVHRLMLLLSKGCDSSEWSP